MKLTINAENVNLLVPFAKAIFIDYYKDLLSLKQREYMVEKFLSKRAILEELNKHTLFSLYFKENEKCAFCEYKIAENKVFLSKLYVH